MMWLGNMAAQVMDDGCSYRLSKIGVARVGRFRRSSHAQPGVPGTFGASRSPLSPR